MLPFASNKAPRNPSPRAPHPPPEISPMTPINPSEISTVIARARGAFGSWSARSLEDRIEFLKKLEAQYRSGKEEIAREISAETGKPLWESRQEVDAMANKIPISIEAYQDRCREVKRSLPDAVG